MGFLLDEQERAQMSEADRVVRDRFRRLLDLLSDGCVEADGLNPQGFVRIPRSVWQRTDLYVDFLNGDLLQDDQDAEMPRAPKKYLFRSIMLRKPAPVAVREPAAIRTAMRKPPFAAVVQSQDGGEARRACRGWLIEEMQSSPDLRTKPKKDWLADARGRWPALSDRAFSGAWAEAISASGAAAWGRPGAPRKGKQN